jgi:2-dehydropantoate 2-reductase
VLISMPNGADKVERICAASPVRAVAAVVYVAGGRERPRGVTSSGRGDLILGRTSASPADADPEPIGALFERADVPCRMADDLRADLWTKMLMNCAYNAVSALTKARYGPIAGDAGARERIRRVMEEAVAVARAEGVGLSADAMTEAAYTLGEAVGGATSSIAQNLGRGKSAEIDSLNGYVVRRAARHPIAVPVKPTLCTLVELREKSLS